MLILTMTTPFINILRALKNLRVPDEMIMIFFFMYRYTVLFIEEINRLFRALKVRSVNLPPSVLLRKSGDIIGVIFIKTYERAERIYKAMIARGFDNNSVIGDDKSAPVKMREIFIASIFIFIIISFKVTFFLCLNR